MNSLSWMLYLAEVSHSLSVAAMIGAFVSGLAIMFHGTSSATYGDEFLVHRPLAWTCVAALLIACALPSKETVYAIAASETGEQALKSKTATKAIQALDAWLDKQIKGESK